VWRATTPNPAWEMVIAWRRPRVSAYAVWMKEEEFQTVEQRSPVHQLGLIFERRNRPAPRCADSDRGETIVRSAGLLETP